MTEQEAIRKAETPTMAEALRRLAQQGRLKKPEELTPAELAGPMVVVGGASHCGIVGSKQARCTCGAIIWLSPSSLEMMARHTGSLTKRCVRCALGVLKRTEAARSADAAVRQ